jgi:plastocyanin
MERASAFRNSNAALGALILFTLLAGCVYGSRPSGSVECHEPVDGVVTLTAAGIAFDTDCLVVPADQAFTIRLINNDGEPHNVAIYPDSSKATELFAGEAVDGGETVDYEVGPLDAGTWYFDCQFHTGMSGSVVVQ